VIKLLLDAGANPDLEDNYSKRTPLAWAAGTGWAAAVQLLLEAKAEVDPQDTAGITPLAWAACNGHLDVVEILLAAGANPNLRDLKGRKPIDWASCGGHQSVVMSLELVTERCP
jgi:ankyrin repeat protein